MTEDRSETLRQLKKQRGHIRSAITLANTPIRLGDMKHSTLATRTLAAELRNIVELWSLLEESLTRDIDSIEQAGAPLGERESLRFLAERIDGLAPENRRVVEAVLREEGWEE